jgi:hypothetical protein
MSGIFGTNVLQVQGLGYEQPIRGLGLTAVESECLATPGCKECAAENCAELPEAESMDCGAACLAYAKALAQQNKGTAPPPVSSKTATSTAKPAAHKSSNMLWLGLGGVAVAGVYLLMRKK